MARLGKNFLLLSLLLALSGVAACGSGSSGSSSTGSPEPSLTRSSEPSLTHCPEEWREIRGGNSPGTEGEVVDDEPVSAIICRWREKEKGQLERDESVVSGPALAGLVTALGLRYAGASGSEVEAEFHSCDVVRTREHYWDASEELRERLDALLGG